MVWGGYFGLWISASLALRTVATPAISTASRRLAARRQSRSEAGAAAHSWDDVVDWLGAEMANLPAAERAALVERIMRSSHYELADNYELDVLPGGRRG
jgi:hypothetical protein